MTAIMFDALGYFEKLKAAGVPEEQAKVQAAALREFTAMQDEKAKLELATKADLRETELNLKKEIREVELRLLKWQIGLAAAIGSFMLAGFGTLATVMAKGFGWLGF